MKNRRRLEDIVPMAGGQDAVAVLERISKQLGEARDPETIAQLQREQAAAEEEARKQAGSPAPPENETPEQELERLRKEASERALHDSMESLAGVTAEAVKRSEVQAREQAIEMFRGMVREKVGGNGQLDPALEEILKNTRGPDRTVSPDADPAFVEHVARGGDGLTFRDKSSIRAGDDVGVKQFFEAKSFAWAVSALHRREKGLAHDFELKALAESTDSAGGFLVPHEWMDDVLGLLRAETVVYAAGPRTTPLGKEMRQVSISSGGTAYWGAENAATPPSEQVFAEAVILTPKWLTSLVPVSNHLLRDSSRAGLESAEEVVRADIAEIMGLAVDLGFLQGSGASGQPRGIKNIVGIDNATTALGVPADGQKFNDDLARNAVARFRTINARNPGLAWFFNPVLINQLEGLKDNEGRYLLETRQLVVNADQRTGSLWNIPFYTTTQIPVNETRGASTDTTYVLLVNMNELWVGESKDMTIDTSNEASYTTDGGTTWINAFQNRQTLFRAEWVGDLTHRRPTQVVRVDGIKTSV